LHRFPQRILIVDVMIQRHKVPFEVP
jgi:hypothetical protein